MAKQSLHLQHATLWIVGAVLVVATITAASTHAQQPPPLPHEFYGSVVVKCQPAPVGATIEARGTNVKIGIPGNPITTTQVGKYGGPTAFDPPRLAVQGDLTNGSPIEFYVNGVKAECAVPGGPWQSSYPFQSQAITELNLRVQMCTFLPLVLR